MGSNGDPKYRIVVLGFWTVDLKEQLKMLTDEPENSEMHRIVIRGTSHKRQRPERSMRFIAGKGQDSLTLRKITENKGKGNYGITIVEFNWLGTTWMVEFNKGLLPSLNQISHGLIAEAMHQLTLAMGDVKE